MQANDIGDIIARFIGSFEISTDAERLRQSYEDFLAARARTEAFEDDGSHASRTSGLNGHAPHDPDIELTPDPFRIEHGRSKALPPQDVDIDTPAIGSFHHAARYDLPGELDAVQAIGARSGLVLHRLAADRDAAPRPDGEVAYHEAGPSSLLAIRQEGTLLDDDVYSAVAGRLPSPAPESFAADFDALLEQAETWSSIPEPTNDTAALKTMLAQAASGEAAPQDGDVAPGAGLSEHKGIYVNGTAGGEAPDLLEILTARLETEVETDAPEPGAGEGSGVATVSLGGNLLLNQAILVEATTFGHTSVVFGNWYETNVIRQLNIVADEDAIVTKSLASFSSGGTQSFNAAAFERLDASDAGAGALRVFPTSYTVDVVEGDLFVSNFIRQIHKVGDGDGALFTSVEHDVTLSMGGNEVLTFTHLSQLTLGYDLVVFGGSVFEGNFIEQINLLFDRDRIGTEGVFAKGTTGETGGNLLYNNALIRTIGDNDAFDEVDPAIRDLVSRFDAGGSEVPAALSSDLSFLGATHLKVLYITGDYVEINAISQLNILSDADSASYVDRIIGDLTADEAVWTVSTGGNILVNDATILDADAAGPRQLGGEYYSDSVLIQADLVADEDGIEVFDTAKLASELVAFTATESADDGADEAGHHHAHAAYDAPIDGVGGILS
ncbi:MULTISPECIES: hypothetical protein [unclassified Aureimonas]|uniref:hypothetical protein n=1 Tax=unclassified Aureimonas TaxID=2615206 RepID=UPI0006F73E2A|nr:MULTISPECIES: hypothetical protein [unclassified Aureimonas]KQT64062.1 hypothetical protein ASG62_03340 [Aureimonas sp. Leaf427]KQT81254.1 hypothetical protein ASG54_00610 [Aureimonas sp. Leaf460]